MDVHDPELATLYSLVMEAVAALEQEKKLNVAAGGGSTFLASSGGVVAGVEGGSNAR